MKNVGYKENVGFIWKKGETVWIRRGRYWEIQEPLEAVVAETSRVAGDKTDQFCVLVRIEGDDHDVRYAPDLMYYQKAHALQAAHLLCVLREIKNSDYSWTITGRIIDGKRG